MVFCLRSAQPQTIKAAHCSPYFLYQYVCLSSCRSVCPSVCLSIRRWGFVWAQLEHKLAGCSLPPARAPGFKLQTADRRQWPPSHPTPPYYTCQLRRPEYVSYTWKLTLCMLVMVIWAMQVSTPILWLVIVPLRCSRTLKKVGGAHPELYFPIRQQPTSLPSSYPSRLKKVEEGFLEFTTQLGGVHWDNSYTP